MPRQREWNTFSLFPSWLSMSPLSWSHTQLPFGVCCFLVSPVSDPRRQACSWISHHPFFFRSKHFQCLLLKHLSFFVWVKTSALSPFKKSAWASCLTIKRGSVCAHAIAVQGCRFYLLCLVALLWPTRFRRLMSCDFTQTQTSLS